MALTVTIQDRATPELQRMLAALDAEKIKPEIGRSVVNQLKGHFYNLNSTRANVLGGRRTQFYSQAAKSTQYQTAADGVTVSVNQVGIRQRLQGGTIQAIKGKYLTIPAIAESYGKRAREFDNLHFVPTRRGGALVENAATLVSFGKKGAKSRGQVGGRVYYWLVPSVVQDPDPTVVPPEAEIQATAVQAIQKAFDRAVRRGEPT